MYCSRCKKYVSDGEEVCPYCGARNFTTRMPREQSQSNCDGSSFGWAFLGFLIPLVGLILYLVWKPDYPLKAASAGKGALISVILSVVCSILLVLVATCAAASLM